MTEDVPAAYKKLAKMSEEAYLLDCTAALASWDQETNMPHEGVEFRAKQAAYLRGKQHQLVTSKKVDDWITECEDAALPRTSEEGVNIREWRYHFEREAKLPKKLVEEFEETCALAHAAWVDARKASDFSKFQPHLEKVLKLRLEQAECWGYEDEPYDALLEKYERGAKTRQISKLFDDLQPDLVDLVADATSGRSRIPKDMLAGRYSEAKQKELNRMVAEDIGFDFNAGRIDTAVHPFCTTLGPRDVRLTTRYDEKDFTSSLYGVLHEAGHGIYEQGLPGGEHATLPIARAVSLGIHESQSRLWENHVGRSAAFWKKWLPTVKKLFPKLEKVTPKKMTQAVNRAQKSFIRVEADEVTYDLHVLLRFRLERALVNKELPVSDLPGAWNEMFEELFEMEVPDDAHGCLQDVHWSFGLIGYFPTYSLGNINAAQLARRAMIDSTIAEDLEKGEFSSLREWLNEKIHSQGTRHLPPDLIKNATGEKPQAHYLLEHLRERYI
tara:strand:+ start:10345 stop:11838 length:1494 start_codon:yes stop_codon:yes gene_type:complete